MSIFYTFSVRNSRFWMGFLILLGAISFHLYTEISLSAQDKYWYDEYYSIWASDPSIKIINAFIYRIFPDSNPPFYYTFLYFVRHFIRNEFISGLLINYTVILIVSLFIIIDAHRSKYGLLGVYAVSTFLLFEPTLRYAIELRAYSASMSIVLLFAYLNAAFIIDRDRKISTLLFCTIGIVCALTHVFAAMACNCIALSTIICTINIGNLKKGSTYTLLSFLVASSVTGLIWYILNRSSVVRISWIKFDITTIYYNFRAFSQQIAGGEFTTLLAILALAVLPMQRSLSNILRWSSLSFALFFLLTIIISFKIPLFVSRYLVISSPLFIITLVFCLYAKPRGSPRFAIILLFFLSSYNGLFATTAAVKSKLGWIGGDFIAKAVEEKGCAASSIVVRTADPMEFEVGPFMEGYTRASGLDPAMFKIAIYGSNSSENDLSGSCSVVGWLEHFHFDKEVPLRPQIERSLGISLPIDKYEIHQLAPTSIIVTRFQGHS